jgi:hypothetical protein
VHTANDAGIRAFDSLWYYVNAGEADPLASPYTDIYATHQYGNGPTSPQSYLKPVWELRKIAGALTFLRGPTLDRKTANEIRNWQIFTGKSTRLHLLIRPANGVVFRHIAATGSRVAELAALARITKQSVSYLVESLAPQATSRSRRTPRTGAPNARGSSGEAARYGIPWGS